ncbi:MAG: hypothetical protein IJP29_06140 [Lachnospiraceae bacterium]|nr:hypothetical protein [Lachnospiraceae bacterium]
MTDQNTFMEVVKNVAEIVRTAEVPMGEEEILAYFSDMDLNENQKKLVLEYIATAHLEENTEAAENKEDTVGNVEDTESDGDGESKVFQMYLNELSEIPSFTVADREKLYERLAAGEESVIDTISKAWLKKVLTIAEGYLADKLNVEDLVQEGNLALFLKLQEMLNCGDAKNMEETLAQAVEEGIMSYCSEITGEKELENTLVGKMSLVHEAKKLLAMDKGREPSLEELSEYTKMSVEELADLQKMMN